MDHSEGPRGGALHLTTYSEDDYSVRSTLQDESSQQDADSEQPRDGNRCLTLSR